MHEHDFGFDVGAKFVVTLPSRAGTNGSTRAQPQPFCKVAEVTPFNQLVYDVRKARNIASGNVKAARPAEGTMAWLVPRRGCDVIGKGYNNSPGVYHNSDFYQEALYHIALSGCVEMFVYCKSCELQQSLSVSFATQLLTKRGDRPGQIMPGQKRLGTSTSA